MREKAKPMPSSQPDVSPEELRLVANGELTLPSKILDEEHFWSVGAEVAVPQDLSEGAAKAVSGDRGQRDQSLLGR